jgi:hypothetical protein
MKVYGGVNMAANKFYYKSLSELQKLAESYKTNLIPNLTTKQDPVYTVANVSKTEFDNITTFLYNAVIKDAKLVERNESAYSLEFSSYLMKYFDEGLSLSDVVSLKKFVDNYNLVSFQYMINNIGSYVFGLTTASSEIDPLSFIGKMTANIYEKIEYLINNAQDQTTKKTIIKWFGQPVEEDDIETANTYTVKEFLRYLKESKTVEALVTLMVISYLSEEGVYQYNSSLSQNSNINLESESFYEDNIEKVLLNIRDQYFTNKKVSIDIDSGPLQTLNIKNDNNSLILSLPLKLVDENENTVEDYNYINSDIIEDSGTFITFSNLFSQLRSNLLEFINLIKITDFTGIRNIDTNLYQNNINYFIENNVTSLVLNLTKDVQDVSKTFFYKDRIIENSYSTFNEEEKKDASIFEHAKAQAGEQITIIDLKGLDFLSYSSSQLSDVRSVFNNNLLGSFTLDPDTGNQRLVKLTYTLIYKELNPVLRQLILSDIQEYKFSRLFRDYNYDSKLILEINKTEGISYLNTLENIYKAYIEENSVFELDDSLRYKYFYSNVYTSRLSDESDIIGYYIGDNTPQSSFTNNYGYYDHQKTEIMNFLEIHKSTRDYYYKVLLNKSFIQEETYPLYEKLFIGWVAIERFLTMKLDNLRDPDSLNDTDVYNFLESYGLGVLNQYDFFLGSKNYKVNIIKNFANLNKLKGSKDVIRLLGSVFDVGDVLVDINKFLLIDISENSNGDDSLTYQSTDISLFTEQPSNETYYELKYNIGGSVENTEIRIYDEDRIYHYEGSFVDADGTELSIQPSNDYYFDEETYTLYDGEMTKINFTLNWSDVNSELIYYNELNNKFFLNGTEIIPTFVSVVTDIPRFINNGDVFYITSKNNFYRKNNKTCELFKVYDYFPSIIEQNLGLKLDPSTKVYTDLSFYDNFTFYTGSAADNTLSLKRYSFGFNTLFDVSFTITNNMPKEKYLINVPWWRFLIVSGLITRTQYERGISIYHSYTTPNTNIASEIFLNSKDYILSDFEYDIASDAAKNLKIILTTKEINSNLKFLEVPDPSNNATRDIKTRLSSAIPYLEFLEVNEIEKIDPYWTKENVPEQTLKDLGLDVVETKYLSLVVSENIYKKYIISRYILSTIEYLETIILEGTTSVADNIIIESGLFQNESLYNYYQVIKVLFKSVLKLYSFRVDEELSEIDTSFKKYYGINQNIN